MKVNWLRRGLMVVMLVLIGLRPTLPGGDSVGTISSNLDVLFVVDTTMSMNAEDYDGGKLRLEGVRSDIAAITTQLAGARFGLIGFDNAAYLAMPFTTDATAVMSAAEVLSPIIDQHADGTDIYEPVELTKKTLEAAAKKIGRVRVVFYMGDGEQMSGVESTTFSEVSDLVDAGAVLGYGTSTGGKIREMTDEGELGEYKFYEEGDNRQDAISVIDESNLQKIAGEIDVDYYYREKPDEAAEITNGIQQKVRQVSSGREVGARQEIYWIFAIVFLVLLFWELWVMLDQLFPRKGKQK